MSWEFPRLIKFVSPYKGTLLLAMSLMLGESARKLLHKSFSVEAAARQILMNTGKA